MTIDKSQIRPSNYPRYAVTHERSLLHPKHEKPWKALALFMINIVGVAIGVITKGPVGKSSKTSNVTNKTLTKGSISRSTRVEVPHGGIEVYIELEKSKTYEQRQKEAWRNIENGSATDADRETAMSWDSYDNKYERG